MNNRIPLPIFLMMMSLAATNPAQAGNSPDPSTPDTYVIVHGAWGGGWAFKEVEQLLRTDGHTVYRPTLTGQGEKVHLAHPGINLTTHITDVVNVILWEDLHNVVLVGHSYGGAVITGVMDQVADRIKHAIYLDAIILHDGESVADATGGGLEGQIKDGFVVPSWLDTEQPVPHDVPHPGKTITEKISLKNQEAVKEIPTTYVLYFEPGSGLDEARFHPFYLRAQEHGWDLHSLASDHNAQWSHPKELVELLKEVAGGRN